MAILGLSLFELEVSLLPFDISRFLPLPSCRAVLDIASVPELAHAWRCLISVATQAVYLGQLGIFVTVTTLDGLVDCYAETKLDIGILLQSISSIVSSPVP